MDRDVKDDAFCGHEAAHVGTRAFLEAARCLHANT